MADGPCFRGSNGVFNAIQEAKMVYALFQFALFLAFILFIISGLVHVSIIDYSREIQRSDSLDDSFLFEQFLSHIVLTVFLIYLLIMLLVRARKNIEWFTKARSTSVFAIYTRFIIACFTLWLFFDSCLRFLFAFLPSGRIPTEFAALTKQQATHEALQSLDWSGHFIPYLFVSMIFCGFFFILTWAVCPGIFTGNMFISREKPIPHSQHSPNPPETTRGPVMALYTGTIRRSRLHRR
jgi:hypothetical protein